MTTAKGSRSFAGLSTTRLLEILNTEKRSLTEGERHRLERMIEIREKREKREEQEPHGERWGDAGQTIRPPAEVVRGYGGRSGEPSGQFIEGFARAIADDDDDDADDGGDADAPTGLPRLDGHHHLPDSGLDGSSDEADTDTGADTSTGGGQRPELDFTRLAETAARIRTGVAGAPKPGVQIDAPPLTKKEAEDEDKLNELVDAFNDYFGYADQMLSAINARKVKASIWSGHDDDEVRAFCKALMAKARTSRIASGIVRQGLEGHMTIMLFALPMVDMWRTAQFIAENGVDVTPRKGRPHA